MIWKSVGFIFDQILVLTKCNNCFVFVLFNGDNKQNELECKYTWDKEEKIFVLHFCMQHLPVIFQSTNLDQDAEGLLGRFFIHPVSLLFSTRLSWVMDSFKGFYSQFSLLQCNNDNNET